MLFLQPTPDTSAYMIAGYAVIVGAIGLFLASLLSRRRNLRKDLDLLAELRKEE
ncbi:MAG: hypothetical protein HY784_11850 [Chloroflexi bacterium]|nr:hypothetical protein [Chloroflexota bacterium]